MKKMNFEKFESVKLVSNQLNKLYGGAATGSGSYCTHATGCGELYSFSYSSDTDDGNGNLSWSGVTNKDYNNCPIQ